MSTHVDSVTLAKRSGDNAVELQVFHVQVRCFCGALSFRFVFRVGSESGDGVGEGLGVVTGVFREKAPDKKMDYLSGQLRWQRITPPRIHSTLQFIRHV